MMADNYVGCTLAAKGVECPEFTVYYLLCMCALNN